MSEQTPNTEDFQAAHIEALKAELESAKSVTGNMMREYAALRDKLATANEQIAALERGEYICKKCFLRSDSTHDKGEYEF